MTPAERAIQAAADLGREVQREWDGNGWTPRPADDEQAGPHTCTCGRTHDLS